MDSMIMTEDELYSLCVYLMWNDDPNEFAEERPLLEEFANKMSKFYDREGWIDFYSNFGR